MTIESSGRPGIEGPYPRREAGSGQTDLGDTSPKSTLQTKVVLTWEEGASRHGDWSSRQQTRGGGWGELMKFFEGFSFKQPNGYQSGLSPSWRLKPEPHGLCCPAVHAVCPARDDHGLDGGCTREGRGRNGAPGGREGSTFNRCRCISTLVKTRPPPRSPRRHFLF